MNELDFSSDYELLDSGNGEKLERFGSRLIRRPSAVCIWKARRSESDWKKADAHFYPGNRDEAGRWQFRNAPFESWEMTHAGCRLELRLQTNGQIGLFPEHGMYLEAFCSALAALPNKKPSVLNLFAYTGLASCVAAKAGAVVTHVDLSKKVLTWANRNFELNSLSASSFRIVCDDAIKFIEKEGRRGKRYDAIIVDPPSFSRASRTSAWKLEDYLPSILERVAVLLASESALFVTCHSPAVTATMMTNVLGDYCPNAELEQFELGLSEKNTERVLPTGSFARAIRK